MTERQPRKAADGQAAVHHQLPTPQTLPRKRVATMHSSPIEEEDEEEGVPSPSGHTTFFLSASATCSSSETLPRRRPGLMFAQQMGLAPGASTDLKFGGRLGLGVGMGGVMRGANHGPIDKVTLDNPFLDTKPEAPHTSNPFLTHLRAQTTPQSPGRDTSYVPQALRRTADRSLSPHPAAELRAGRAGAPTPSPPAALIGDTPGPSMLTPRRQRQKMMDEDNPFVAKPGESVTAHPTSEDHPLVTYVFRGSKKVFANPFVPPSAHYPPSTLDAAHPEFDTHPCPAPRLLWPTGGSEVAVDGVTDDEFVAEESASSDDEPARRLLFGKRALGLSPGALVTPEGRKKRVRL